jgi:hypothetical protein
LNYVVDIEKPMMQDFTKLNGGDLSYDKYQAANLALKDDSDLGHIFVDAQPDEASTAPLIVDGFSLSAPLPVMKPFILTSDQFEDGWQVVQKSAAVADCDESTPSSVLLLSKYQMINRTAVDVGCIFLTKNVKKFKKNFVCGLTNSNPTVNLKPALRNCISIVTMDKVLPKETEREIQVRPMLIQLLRG